MQVSLPRRVPTPGWPSPTWRRFFALAQESLSSASAASTAGRLRAATPQRLSGCYTHCTLRLENTRKGAPVVGAVHRLLLHEENVRSCKGNLGQGDRPRRRELTAQPPSLRAELFFQRTRSQSPQLRRPHPVGRLQAEMAERVSVELQDRARRFASNRLVFRCVPGVKHDQLMCAVGVRVGRELRAAHRKQLHQNFQDFCVAEPVLAGSTGVDVLDPLSRDHDDACFVWRQLRQGHQSAV